DGPVVLLVSAAGIPSRLTIKIARAPFVRLGVPPSALGVTAPPDLELNAEATFATGRFDANFSFALFDMKLGASPPLDLRLKGTPAGDPTKPFDLKSADLAMGPFAAKASGTVTPSLEGGFRADLSWRAEPIPCDLLAKRTAQGAAAMGLQFAQAFGI